MASHDVATTRARSAHKFEQCCCSCLTTCPAAAAAAPQMALGLPGKYTCGHNIILAHAKTIALYKQKYAASQHGKFSIALDGKWGYAKDPSNPAGGWVGGWAGVHRV